MEWLRENWFFVVVLILFVWAHMKMHAGHGAHRAKPGSGQKSDGDHHGNDALEPPSRGSAHDQS